MNYKTAGAFRDALEKRLRDHSGRTGISLVRLRKAIVFDRLLARLLYLGQDRWVVKGALALDFRLGSVTRTTMDMDLEHTEGGDTATADIIEAQSVDLADYFEFDIEIATTQAATDAHSTAYRVRAELAGRVFDEVTIDVGFTDPADLKIDIVLGTALLEFAEIQRISIPVLALEQHVAEKVHAYTRIYGDGLPSSRVKDLIDLVLIKSFASINARRLRAALENTFNARALQQLPEKLPPPPEDWSTPYGVLAKQVGVDEDLALGHIEAAKFLDPVLSSTAEGKWNPDLNEWVLG